MKAFATMALVAIAAGCGRNQPPGDDPRIVDASRPLVFITENTGTPSAYTGPSGEIVGTDVDFARRIAAKMGRQLVVEGVMFTEILPRLKAGTADFAISSITITEARQRDVSFSEPYETSGSCFLYRKGRPVPRMSQVASFRVGVEEDTVQDIYLCRHGCDPMRFYRLDEMFAALENDEIDAVFFDAPPLTGFAESSGGRFAVTPLVTREGYGVAVDKRRPDVLAAANAVISEGGAK